MGRAAKRTGRPGQGRRSAGTQATLALDRSGIDYSTHRYQHDPDTTSYGLEAAEALGVDPDRVFKTLLVVGAAGAWAVAVLPVSRQLDLKRCAAAVGEKKVQLAAAADAERLTGYVVGGISPIGQKRKLPTVLDEAALQHGTILVSGGQRGFDVELAPRDLLTITGGSAQPIAAANG